VRTETAITPPPSIPAGTNAARDGVVLGTGPVTVDAFIDFLCPFCKQFEATSGPALEQMVEDGVVTLVYHPLGYLDRLSTTRYSSRSSAASGCASDQDHFAQYKDALFANQPPEGGPGLSDRELIALGRLAGIGDSAFAECVAAGRYLPWTAFVTERAAVLGVSGTPSTYVEGIPVPANASMIAAAVATAG
jgi:protein-disulfide isomerase